MDVYIRGCPRVSKAAHLLFTNPNMIMDEAMALARYGRSEIKNRAIRKSISK
jgi:Flp pilus assembly protein TadD